MKRIIPSIVLIFLCCFIFAASKPKLDSRLLQGWNSIRPMDPYNYCRTLSSQDFAGRQTGHIGYTKAARWAADKFRQWGLKPISSKDGYLQPYASPYSVMHQGEMTVFIKETAADGKETKIKEVKPQLIKEFMPLLFSDMGQKRGGTVFVGWGIHAPDLGYDDYAGVDVRNKFVICFRGVPDGGADKRFQHHDEHRTRMKTAKELGALGLIYIYSEIQANPNGDRIEGFLPAMINEPLADSILKEKSANCADLKKALITYKKPLSFTLSAEIDLKVDATYDPKGIGYNVAGYIEGTDTKLKNECILIGGHFDGQGEHFGSLFAGADDNASGSAVVMEIAEAFARNSSRPRRSVMFVLFGGEEMGLMGSTYFADHLPVPFKKVDLMINYDMEGEGDMCSASYSADVEVLKDYVQKADQYVGKVGGMRPMRSVGVRGSDFAPFFAKGSPCLSFMSNGPHLFYHQPGDSIYRNNPEIMADISRIGYLTSFFWADRK